MRLSRWMWSIPAWLALLGAPAVAAWPERPITIIYPYAPGSDGHARALAEAFQQEFGQGVVVVNRDGASGVIGMRAVAQAAPDGYTLGMTPMTPIAVQPHMVRNLGVGPESFAPICNVTDNILGLVVRADSSIRDARMLIEEAERRQLSYGSPGPNSIPFIAVHRMAIAAGGDFLHVPYRGSAVSVTELLGGRLDFATIVVATGGPMIKNGQLRLIGVFSERRHPEFPDAPTMREQGIDIVQPSYAGLYAPRGTPKPVLERLEAACRRALDTEAFRRAAASIGAAIDFRDRAELARLLTEEYATFGRILRELGVRAQ
jgi:tripartite-type tricarboxylate transporter receptor subunit TctC